VIEIYFLIDIIFKAIYEVYYHNPFI